MEKNETTSIEQNIREAPIAIVDNPIEDVSQLDTVQEDKNGSIALLYPEEYVKQTIHEMAEIIKERFKGKKNTLFLEVLNGAKPLADELKKELDIQDPDSDNTENAFCAYVDQIHPSSYRNGMEQDELVIKKDMKFDPKGKDVLIVEDVIDSYKTMSELKNMLLERGARSVTVAVLCNKRDKEDADISGFMIDKNHWLVGCGLGTAVEGQENEKYRIINNQRYALGVFIPK